MMDIHTCPHQQLQLDWLAHSHALQIRVQRRYKDKRIQVKHLNRCDFAWRNIWDLHLLSTSHLLWDYVISFTVRLCNFFWYETCVIKLQMKVWDYIISFAIIAFGVILWSFWCYIMKFICLFYFQFLISTSARSNEIAQILADYIK